MLTLPGALFTELENLEITVKKFNSSLKLVEGIDPRVEKNITLDIGIKVLQGDHTLVCLGQG